MIDLPQKILTDHRKGRNKRITDWKTRAITATTAMTKSSTIHGTTNKNLE